MNLVDRLMNLLARKPPFPTEIPLPPPVKAEKMEPWKQYLRDKQRCPDCETGLLLRAVVGGMRQTYSCANCAARFSIVREPNYFWAERLPKLIAKREFGMRRPNDSLIH